MKKSRYRILFVCMANFCRSPTAQGVVQRLVDQAGLSKLVELDSAGTHDYRKGEAPDPRAIKAASARSIDITRLRARSIRRGDFERFDLILSMDSENYDHLHYLCPSEQRHKLKMLMEYAEDRPEQEVPDPIAGPYRGFEEVLDLLEAAGQGLVNQLKEQFSN
jgi:protein-tyrosine phosphatase